jgi:NAD-dependent dihydropyrimidine dehydrogenase PreA subunit
MYKSKSIPNDVRKMESAPRSARSGIFVQREKLTIPEMVNEETCIACGHCVAICPQNAIQPL